MKKTLTLGALLFAAVLILAGCGTNAGTDSSKSFNDQDVSFAQRMIPHHRQAVEMATLARTRASDPRVRRLADQIKTAQGPEISTMTRWLESWGKKAPSDSMGGSMGGDGSMGSMPGMMSGSEMSRLKSASGSRFDRLFLHAMTQHHAGAVEMAKTEQAKGRAPSAVALAVRIEKTQTAELATMKELLGS